MQRKTAANEQNKVHKLLFSIYLSSGKLIKGVSRSCQAIIICKKLPVAGSVGYKLALQLFPLGCRQGEDKFSADSFGTNDVDIFIMCLNNFFYDRESKTGTLLVLSTGQVGFVETLKNFVLAVFWNSDAGILDRNKYFFAFLGGLNGDFRIMVAELDGIVNQIINH